MNLITILEIAELLIEKTHYLNQKRTELFLSHKLMKPLEQKLGRSSETSEKKKMLPRFVYDDYYEQYPRLTPNSISLYKTFPQTIRRNPQTWDVKRIPRGPCEPLKTIHRLWLFSTSLRQVNRLQQSRTAGQTLVNVFIDDRVPLILFEYKLAYGTNHHICTHNIGNQTFVLSECEFAFRSPI